MMRSKLGIAAVLAGLVTTFAAHPGFGATPSQHDPAFPDGLVRFDFRGTADRPAAILTLGNGDTILAGTSVGPGTVDDSPALIALLPNGRPDPAFGDANGRTVVPLGDPAQLVDLARGPNDTIVGLAANRSLGALWLFRLTASGHVDTTFNPGVGSIELDPGPSIVWTTVSVARDGAIVIAGTLTPDTGDREIAWMAIAANGDTTGSFLSGVAVGAGDAFAVDSATDPRSTINRIDVVGSAVDAAGRHFAHIIAVDPSTGDPDTTFGGDGRLSVKDPSRSATPNSIFVQGDGRIVLGLTAGAPARPEVIRLTNSGAIDGTFSGDGIATMSIGSFRQTIGVKPSPDGELRGSGIVANNGIVAFRMTAAGATDLSFGTNGVTTVFPAALTFPRAIAVDANNRLFVGGASNDGDAEDLSAIAFTASGALDGSLMAQSGTASQFALNDQEGAADLAIDGQGATFVAGSVVDGGQNDMFVEKLTPAGHRDTSFGGDGWGRAGFGDANASAIALSGGKVVLAGCAHCQSGRWSMARLTDAGVPDTTFSGDGRTTVDWGGSTDSAEGVAVQSNGKVVAVGRGNSQFAVARFLVGGGLDPTFSGDGKLIATTSQSTSGEAADVAVLPSGKILVAGRVDDGKRGLVLVVQLNADGTFDHGFSGNGRAVFAPADDVVAISGLAVRSDGRILVSGTVSANSHARALVLRLTPGGAPDSSFSGDGVATLSFGNSDVQGLDIAAQGNKVLLAIATGDGAFTAARLAKDGTPDPAFGGDGLASVRVEQTDAPSAIAIRQSDGRIYEAGIAMHDLRFDFGIAAFLP